jgi:hypothetical protein
LDGDASMIADEAVGAYREAVLGECAPAVRTVSALEKLVRELRSYAEAT